MAFIEIQNIHIDGLEYPYNLGNAIFKWNRVFVTAGNSILCFIINEDNTLTQISSYDVGVWVREIRAGKNYLYVDAPDNTLIYVFSFNENTNILSQVNVPISVNTRRFYVVSGDTDIVAVATLGGLLIYRFNGVWDHDISDEFSDDNGTNVCIVGNENYIVVSRCGNNFAGRVTYYRTSLDVGGCVPVNIIFDSSTEYVRSLNIVNNYIFTVDLHSSLCLFYINSDGTYTVKDRISLSYTYTEFRGGIYWDNGIIFIVDSNRIHYVKLTENLEFVYDTYRDSINNSFNDYRIGDINPGNAFYGTTDYQEDTILVFSLPEYPVDIDFQTSIQSATLNSNITFNNNIQSATYLWDFGDSTSSTLQNPTHSYSAIGNFTVTLTVNEIFQVTKENFITIYQNTYVPTSGCSIRFGDYLGILTNGIFDSNHTSANAIDVFLWGWWEGCAGNIINIYLDYPDVFFCNEVIGESATGNFFQYDDMPVMWCG